MNNIKNNNIKNNNNNIQIGGKGSLRHKKKKFIRNDDRIKFQIINTVQCINSKI